MDAFDRTGFRDPIDFLHAGDREPKIIARRDLFHIDAQGLMWRITVKVDARGDTQVIRNPAYCLVMTPPGREFEFTPF